MQTFKSSTNAYQHKYALFIFNPMTKLMADHLGWGFFFNPLIFKICHWEKSTIFY